MILSCPHRRWYLDSGAGDDDGGRKLNARDAKRVETGSRVGIVYL